MARLIRSGAWLLLAAGVLGCTADPIVPTSLQSQVDPHLTFTQLRESPQSYSGRVVVFSGEVLNAKLLKQGTRIEVLELPLEVAQSPTPDRTQSQGRFLAIQKDFLDPATIPPGTRVTIVGEVTGATTLQLDETDYSYPTLEVKNLKVWPGAQSTPYWAPPFYPYYYWGPRWGRRGYYPYWW